MNAGGVYGSCQLINVTCLNKSCSDFQFTSLSKHGKSLVVASLVNPVDELKSSNTFLCFLSKQKSNFSLNKMLNLSISCIESIS